MNCSTRFVACALLVAACGIDSGLDTQALEVEPVPNNDPFQFCTWRHGLDPKLNLGFTGYGYWGDQRGFRIHSGNYVDGATDYLEYKIEVIWSLPGCTGDIYYVRFPLHAIVNHAEIEVRGATQGLKGKLLATKGSLPVLYNQANVALPTHKLGPFVITPAMVGAGGMADTIAFTLLDTQVLSRLPYPAYYNGALPGSLGQESLLATAYDDLVEDNEYLYSFFKFRLSLATMTPTERQDTSDAIDLVKDETGPIHGDPLWEEHHHVVHSLAVDTAQVGVGFGGFWNGHRNMLNEIEGHLREQPIVPGFGRVPTWDPATTVPAEFEIGIVPTRLGAAPGNLSGGTDLEVQYRAANICANFAVALSPLPTPPERYTDREHALWDDVDNWHNDVHISVAGDLGPITTSANVPLFYPWHTTVDVIWQNWQLCEAAYHPNWYSWDAL